MKPAWRYWTGFLFLPAVVVLVLLSTDVEVFGPKSAAPTFTYEESGPGAVLASVPAEGEGEPVFEGLVDLALAHDQQSFFALDALAAKLYRFDLDGGLLGVMGRQGSGPAEMEFPSGLQPVPEGVWALDPQGLRATLWGSDGVVLKTLSLANAGVVATTFVPVGAGLLLPVAGPPMLSQPDERFFHLSDGGGHPVSGGTGGRARPCSRRIRGTPLGVAAGADWSKRSRCRAQRRRPGDLEDFVSTPRRDGSSMSRALPYRRKCSRPSESSTSCRPTWRTDRCRGSESQGTRSG